VVIKRSLAALTVILSTVGCAPPEPRTPAASLQTMRETIAPGTLPGIRLSFLRSGDAKGVPIIFIHGTPGEAEGWADYVGEPLSGTLSIALDRPGFGESGPAGAVTSLATQAAAVAALFPADGRSVVLVGHSLGGPIAAWAAAEHPERVRALVLLAGSLDPGQEKIHPLQPLGQMWPVKSLLPRALRNANDELMALKPELEHLQALLPRVTAPTIIVHGTADDLVPFANVAYVQSHLTGAKCIKTVVLQGQNHFLPWNSEATVRDALRWAVEPTCPTP
jgi:pimeloyl-ACP methyl ester carboxylesterase